MPDVRVYAICPECHATLQTPSSLIGVKVKCRKCGHSFLMLKTNILDADRLATVKKELQKVPSYFLRAMPQNRNLHGWSNEALAAGIQLLDERANGSSEEPSILFFLASLIPGGFLWAGFGAFFGFVIGCGLWLAFVRSVEILQLSLVQGLQPEYLVVVLTVILLSLVTKDVHYPKPSSGVIFLSILLGAGVGVFLVFATPFGEEFAFSESWWIYPVAGAFTIFVQVFRCTITRPI